jgi:hypothetical protein
MSCSQSNTCGEAILTSLVDKALIKLCNGELKARFKLDKSSFQNMTKVPKLCDTKAPLFVFLRAAAFFDHVDDKTLFHGMSKKFQKKCAKESRKLLLILTRDKWYQVIKAFMDGAQKSDSQLNDKFDEDNQNFLSKRKDYDDVSTTSLFHQNKKVCTGSVSDDKEEDDYEEDDYEEDDYEEDDYEEDNYKEDDYKEEDDNQASDNQSEDDYQVEDDYEVNNGYQVEANYQVKDKDRDMLEQVPDCVKDRFGHIYFTKWGKGRQSRYLPVLVVNPFDIPPGEVRQEWIDKFKSSCHKGKLEHLSNLVFWYGSLSLQQLAFSFIPTQNLVNFETGCERKYDDLPEFLADKLKKGKVLSSLDTQHCQALLEMKDDASFMHPKNRWPNRMKILCQEYEHEHAPGLTDVIAGNVCGTKGCSNSSSTGAEGTKKTTLKPKSVAKETKPLSESCEQAKLKKIFQDLGNVVDPELMPPAKFKPPILFGKGRFCQANRLYRLLLAYPRRLAGVSYRNQERFDRVMRDGRCEKKVCKRDTSFDANEFKAKYIVDPEPNNWPPGFEKLEAEDVIILDESWVVKPPTGKGKENICQRRMYFEDASSTQPKMLAHLVCEMECNRTKNKRREFIKMLFECAGIKGNVKRGKNRLDLSELYMCFGFRFAYDGKKLECYTYKKGVDKATQDEYNAKISTIMDALWEIAFGKIDPDDLNAMLSVAKLTGLYGVTMAKNGLHSQFSCSRNYMVRSHTDDDGMVGVICVLDPIKPNSRKTITHFIFPEFKLAFPLKSGDVLIFDPRVMHCSCNPRNQDAFIFSAYTSAKTVHAHIANWMLEKGILDG